MRVRLLKLKAQINYNKTIAEIFFKAGFIEAWGRGISKIITGFKLAKLTIPDFEAKMGGIVVTVYRKTGGNEGLNEGLKSLLNTIIKYPGLQNKDLSEKLNNRPVKTIERQISELIKLNKIKRKGSKKTGGYYAK